ncbi:hypothetical protein GCM10028807_57730 [Spirosoma daeguense]
MSNSSQFRRTTAEEVAKADSAQAKKNAQNLLDDYFSQPYRLNNLRRNLRVWFINNVLQWEENFGGTLKEQILDYEMLDELLTELIIANLSPEKES